jgi:hypothetical protein
VAGSQAKSPSDVRCTTKWKLGQWSEGGYGEAIVAIGDPDLKPICFVPEKAVAEDIIRQHNEWVDFNFG